MGWVNQNWNTKVYLKPYQTDLNMFRVVKTRHSSTCCNCKKVTQSKGYVYGSDFIRLCLSCGYEFSNIAIKEIEKVIDYIKFHQDLFNKNKQDWINQNMLANL